MPEIDVLDSTMYYEETAGGPPWVFLHGNPGSSHVWRKVLPAVAGPARLLAPDLIGMGRSGKPDVPYRFADHARYLDAWFDAVGLDEAVLVGHDWGGALAFDRAARHPDRVRGVAVMETIVRPLTWNDFPNAARPRYEGLRGPAGEVKVLEENFFITQALRAGGAHRPGGPARGHRGGDQLVARSPRAARRAADGSRARRVRRDRPGLPARLRRSRRPPAAWPGGLRRSRPRSEPRRCAGQRAPAGAGSLPACG
jgi:pimeloyl-ACP methyl ester carboxylesterase